MLSVPSFLFPTLSPRRRVSSDSVLASADDTPTQRPPTQRPIDRLLAIMARLRDPVRGCPWDVEQSFRTVAPHTIEEAYEVADAIERDDLPALRDELGDLLFQVVFHSRIAEERGAFAAAA